MSTAKKSRTVRGKKNQKLFNLELDDEPDNDEDDFYTGHVTKAFFDDIKANGLRLDQNLYNEGNKKSNKFLQYPSHYKETFIHLELRLTFSSLLFFIWFSTLPYCC